VSSVFDLDELLQKGVSSSLLKIIIWVYIYNRCWYWNVKKSIKM